MGIRHRHAAATGVWNQPTTLFTALGIGGLAVSLGLKDTIANVIGGFGLMLGRVIQPGDYVKVAGITGTVKDINWRQTIVRERNRQRNGHPELHPQHCITGKARSIERMPGVSTVHRQSRRRRGTYEGRHHRNRATGHGKLANPLYKPVVKLNGFTPYGIDGTIYAFAKNDLLLSTMVDAVAQAIAHADYLEHRAVSGSAE